MDKKELDSTNRVNFLLASIVDMQSSIRAYDTKIIAIFVIIALPITQLNLLISIYYQLIKASVFWGIILLGSFVFCWLMSLIFSFLCVLSIDNPVDKAKNDSGAKGFFYTGNLYNLKFKNLLFINSVKSTSKLSDRLHSILVMNVEEELVYEQMKLAYIRDIKSKRQKVALIFTFIGLFIGLFSWLYILIKFNI